MSRRYFQLEYREPGGGVSFLTDGDITLGEPSLLYREAREWCAEHLKGRWKDDDFIEEIIVYEIDDALLFKIRWC